MPSIVVLEISCDWDLERCNEAYARLPEDIQIRSDRYLSQASRRNLIATRSRLYEVLRLLGHHPHHVTVAENGRPFLKSQAVQFNLSHSQDRGALAVSTDINLKEGLGVDLESISRTVDFTAIGHRFFTRPEAEWIGDHRERFFHVWTRKEAVLKSNGIGLRMPLDRFEVLRSEVSEDVTGRTLALQSQTRDDNYLISLAYSPTAHSPHQVHWLDDREQNWAHDLVRLLAT